MSCLIAVLKCILCEDDDDDRSSRQSYNAPLTRQSNSGVTNSSYSTGVYRDPLLYTTALDRDPELYSRRNAPPTSQSNSGVVTNSSFKTCSDSYPSQVKSTGQYSAPTQLSRDGASKSSSYSTVVYRDHLLYSTALDRDHELYSRFNAPPTSQSNSGVVTNSSFTTRIDSYPSQVKSTVQYSAPTQLSRDEASKSSSYSTGVYRDPLLYTTALDRDPELYSRRNAPLPTSQSSSGVTSSSFRTQNDSSPSQVKSTNVKKSVPVQQSRDDVSDSYSSKQPLVPNCLDSSTKSESLKPPPKSQVASPLPLIHMHPSSHSGQTRKTIQESGFSQPAWKSDESESPKPPPKSQCLKPPPATTKPSICVDAGATNRSYSAARYRDPELYTTALDRDPELYSRRNAPPTSQSNCGVANSSFRTENDSSYFPNVPNRTTTESPKPPPKSPCPKAPPINTKPAIRVASSSFSSPQNRNAYIWVEKGASSTYVFPKEVKSLIEKDIVPGVLKMPLSKSSYKDYFHALLYAEDCYCEKWDGFEMNDVKVQLHEAAIYNKRSNDKNLKEHDDIDEKVFVTFELPKIREMRPFLISRDFVSLQPVKQNVKPFQGVIYRVVKSNLVLAEFGDEFFSRHHSDNKYDVKFSFNRVCLKRAHQAVAAASESLFRNLIFPDTPPKHELSSSPRYIYQKEPLAVAQILTLQGLPPCLVEGPLAAVYDELSKTGMVVVEAIIQILRADPSKRILLCAPMNRTCDVLMRGLKKEIAESEMFRANAAFREDVPEDILPSCLYTNTGDTECFICPEFAKLIEYKVISTTFMSSYRLFGEGINAGYFSHIFVVDASSATEPEAMVPLTNFVTAKTVVVVTGAPGNHSRWIRSKIARENGLVTSYFERLCNSGMYQGLDTSLWCS